MKVVATIAYYGDPNNISLEKNFFEIVRIFSKICSQVVIVSTSELKQGYIKNYTNVLIIKRPNLGYDFYSYRVGLNFLVDNYKFDKIFFVNSSFILLDSRKFRETLYKMIILLKNNNLIGLSKSSQISEHIQSYLLLISYEICKKRWFYDFINLITLQDSKLNTIIKYEIGLSNLLKQNKIKLVALLHFNLLNFFKFYVENLLFHFSNNKNKSIFLKNFFKYKVNYSLYGFEKIISNFGIIKKELLRNAPLNINTNSLKKLVCKKKLLSLKKMMLLEKKLYLHKNGLTELNNRNILISEASYSSSRIRNVKVAIILHLYHQDLIEEIKNFLKIGIVDLFDIYVTTPFQSIIPRIIDEFSDFSNFVSVILCKNIGRDIAPFVELYKSGVLDKYSAVLKIHTKKSSYSSKGEFWRKDIYNSLMGNSLRTRKVISFLNDNKNVGMIGTQKYYLTNPKFWGSNKQKVTEILNSLSIINIDQYLQLEFFSGSMFWFKPSAFDTLKKINNDQFHFEIEKNQRDGTLAHAYERIFSIIVKNYNYNIYSCENLEIIDKNNCFKNTIPVI
jgi:rhamnosyltransferase